MPLQSRYVFSAAMDVEPGREALFNEVYDKEHVPLILGRARRHVRRALQAPARHDGHRRREEDHRDRERAPLQRALRDREPRGAHERGMGKAVDQGRWTGEVRPYTKNRRHMMLERLG